MCHRGTQRFGQHYRFMRGIKHSEKNNNREISSVNHFLQEAPSRLLFSNSLVVSSHKSISLVFAVGYF